jgi:hypothetical protein
VGYRSFDRQFVIPDGRLHDQARPDLWDARIDGQVFAIEQHAHAFGEGPGLVFTALIPDMHHFNNRGGRALPALHPDGSENVAPGLLDQLGESGGGLVGLYDLIAYIAAIADHQ